MFVELDTRHDARYTVSLEWDRNTGETQIVVGDSGTSTPARVPRPRREGRRSVPPSLQVRAVSGYVDTDMAAWFDGPKTAPGVVAAATLDAVESGEHEVLVDEFARQVRAGLSGPLTELCPALATPAGSI